jgi:hypothetical protein
MVKFFCPVEGYQTKHTLDPLRCSECGRKHVNPINGYESAYPSKYGEGNNRMASSPDSNWPYGKKEEK